MSGPVVVNGVAGQTMTGAGDDPLLVDQESEQRLLGIAILTPGVASTLDLRPDAFSRPDHATIYAAALSVAEQDSWEDSTGGLVAVAAELRRRGKLEAVGGLPALTALCNVADLQDAAPALAAQIACLAVRRRVVQAGGKIADAAYDVADPEALAARVQAALTTAGFFLPEQTLRDAVPAQRKTGATIMVVTAQELAEQTPEATAWVVPGLVAVGGITEVDGGPKTSGKTTFLLALVAAVLDGRDFLGQPTQATGVVYLSEQTTHTLRPPLARAGLLGRDDLVIVPWHANRRLPYPEVVRQAVALCLDRGWRLLIVDTLSQWAGLSGESENQSGAALAAMQPLQDAAGRGLAVAVARHDRKGGGAVGESARGSNAFTGAVDVVLQLARPEGAAPETQRVLSALSRFSETPARLVITLEPGGYRALGDVRAVVTNGVRDAILESLPADPERAWNLDDLLDACAQVTGRRPARSTVQDALSGLIAPADGRPLVVAMTMPSRGSPRRYYRLPG